MLCAFWHSDCGKLRCVADVVSAAELLTGVRARIGAVQ